MIFYGLDEAALGPRIGPFCCCLVGFQQSSTNFDINLYDFLSDLVTQEPDLSERIPVADSKRLYSPASGLGLLELGVGRFAALAGLPFPGTFRSLLEAISPPSDMDDLMMTPWLAEAESLDLPIHNPPTGQYIDSQSWMNKYQQKKIHFISPRLRFLSARRFNAYLNKYGGKSGALREAISSLVFHAVESSRSNTVRLVVDRQGGRRYYGEWLVEVLPGVSLRALEEGKRRSAYTTGPLHIEFTVSADVNYLETALASMFSKYIRELGMLLFNRWWRRRIPEIKPTAGYPEDAKRFLEDLAQSGISKEEIAPHIRRL